MKEEFIRDILKKRIGYEIHGLSGWIQSLRRMKTVLFIDLIDSTGVIQAIVSRKILDEFSENPKQLQRESAITISGTLVKGKKKKEIQATEIHLVSPATLEIAPKPRLADIFASDMTDHLINNRHLYIRNPQFVSIMKFRSKIMEILSDWFRRMDFIEVHTPILA